MQAILGAIDPHQKTSKDARTCRECLLANRHRLEYPRFRRMGLCTSSGVVEAGCKLAVGRRLKRAGMHWIVDGANAIMALRACRLSCTAGFPRRQLGIVDGSVGISVAIDPAALERRVDSWAQRG